MKKTIVIAIVVGTLAGLGGHMALYGGVSGPKVTDVRPAPAAGELVAANGRVEGALPELKLRPEVAGVLAAVNVAEQDAVTKGQVLAELSNGTQKAQVKLAGAELGLAKESLRRLQNGERRQIRDRAKADADAKATSYEQAKRDYERAVRSGGGISAGDLDAARLRVSVAKADADKAKADLDLIAEGARSEDVRIAERKVEAAEAKLQAAEADLAKTRLVAPADGKVQRLWGHVGELASPTSDNPVLIFDDLSKRRVRAWVEELDVARVAVGQAATVTADGLRDKVFTGKVVEVLDRMSKGGPESDAANELKDLHYREALIDLDAGENLPTNLRVQVRIQAGAQEQR
jgi:multidrug resistance efflux pump